MGSGYGVGMWGRVIGMGIWGAVWGIGPGLWGGIWDMGTGLWKGGANGGQWGGTQNPPPQKKKHRIFGVFCGFFFSFISMSLSDGNGGSGIGIGIAWKMGGSAAM